MAITRRFFMLTGATVGGGLLLGVGGLTAHLATHDRLEVQRDGHRHDDSVLVNLWLRITADNHIVVINPHTDMGQGTATGLMQIVADELDASWPQMRVEQAPADPAYSNGKVLEGFVREAVQIPDWASNLAENGFYRVGDLMNMQMTGGSTAVRFTGWDAMRHAAAAARVMLLEAAAQHWGVAAAELSTADGQVHRLATGDTLEYGKLAAKAAALDTPHDAPPKDPANYRFVGSSLGREDVPRKVMANQDYAIDAEVPNMHYAAVVGSGVFGAQVASIDNLDDIKAARGVSEVLIVPDGVAVVADNPWRAEQAVRKVKFTTEAHANSSLSTASAMAAQRSALAETDALVEGYRHGEPDDITPDISAEYSVPYLAHASLEPMNATVWRQDGKLQVVAGVQNPLLARQRIADVIGLDLHDVVLHARQMGGGFGRRVAFSMSGDEPLNWLIQAVKVVLDSGKSVKTTWSRETDTRNDVYRPMVVAQLDATLADDGKPLLWRSSSFGKENNAMAVVPPYQVPNIDIRFADQPHPVPVGFWRSVEHSQHGYFVESFIDELAAQAGADPLQYRLNLTDPASPQHKVLQKVANMSGWRHGPDAQGRAMGVAMVHCFGSTIAQVVEASITPAGPRAHRVWCAVDCGVAVNPQAIEAQVQGSVHFGLSAALYGKCDLKDGGVVQSNFHDYRLVGMAQAPRVEVALLDLGSSVGGVGEIGVPPLAPALANALAAIDGQRRRALPLV